MAICKPSDHIRSSYMSSDLGMYKYDVFKIAYKYIRTCLVIHQSNYINNKQIMYNPATRTDLVPM